MSSNTRPSAATAPRGAGSPDADAPDRSGTAPRTTRVAGLAAAAALLGTSVVALLAPEAVGDHATTAGRVSEALAGLSFIASAVALVPLAPRRGLSRAAWFSAPLFLTIAGLTMVGVVVGGTEPSVVVFLVGALGSFVGTVAVGVIGWRHRTWPRWVSVGVALVLPVMFLVPFNALVNAVTWTAVALRSRRPADAGAPWARRATDLPRSAA